MGIPRRPYWHGPFFNYVKLLFIFFHFDCISVNFFYILIPNMLMLRLTRKFVFVLYILLYKFINTFSILIFM